MTDESEIAETFNTFFANIVTNLKILHTKTIHLPVNRLILQMISQLA